VFRVLARASMLLAVAPVSPVSWWPGAHTLPESVLRRLPNSGYRGQTATLQPSGTRVIAIPVEGGRAAIRPRTLVAPLPGAMAAPWGEPLVAFAGVTVSTCQVPHAWLRPATKPVAAPAPRATITPLRRQPRAWPPVQSVVSRPGPHGRFRRAATLALGLFVSLVAVEAAARSTRR
jgi:hypothetical protein